jgi:hypothetical protein
MDEANAAACPFCPPEEEKNLHCIQADGGHQVVCCTCLAAGPERPTPELAIAAWNNRQQGSLRAKLAQLIDAFEVESICGDEPALPFDERLALIDQCRALLGVERGQL